MTLRMHSVATTSVAAKMHKSAICPLMHQKVKTQKQEGDNVIFFCCCFSICFK